MQEVLLFFTGLVLVFILLPILKFLTSYMQMNAWIQAYQHFKNKPKKEDHGKTKKETNE